MNIYRIIGVAALGGLLANPAFAQLKLPQDVYPTCVVTPEEFAGWGKDGQINAANSTTFDDSTDCDFYKWGAQMFLWLTSSGGNKIVYNGDDFLDVVTNPAGGLEFVALNDDGVGQFAPRKAKNDNDEAVAQTGGSGVLIAPPPSPNHKGSIVYYGIKANNVYAYYLSGQKASYFKNPDAAKDQTDLQADFPTTAGDLSWIEQYVKQEYRVDSISSGIALAMELKSSWVEASSLENPEDYITVDAQIATFDTSDPTGQKWPENGVTTTKMAMVGMHVVGSVKDHPEMVWATFEHIDNVPQNAYVYIARLPFSEPLGFMPVPREAGYDGNAGTKWVFNDSPGVPASQLPILDVVERSEYKEVKDTQGKVTGHEIAAMPGQTIGPDKVVRINPWGDQTMTLAEFYEDPLAGKAGASIPAGRATDLISLHLSLTANLPAGDVRKNYIQTGSIWSSGGVIPTGDGTGTSKDDKITAEALRGNIQLANSTMETYHQFPDSHSTGSFMPKNCFGCHGVDKPDSPSIGVSHIFDDLNPLNPPLK
jgi:hypothetical protein